MAANAQVQSFARFRFTFRSFQTQDCMTDEFFTLYGGTRSSNDPPGSVLCAPQSVRAGHPDFQAFRPEIAFMGTEPFVKPQLVIDESGIGKPQYCNDVTVASMMATGEGVVCGRPFTSTYFNGSLLASGGRYPQTSGKDRFEEWYRDVPRVNKRRGELINFLSETQLVAGTNRTVFTFDSTDPLFSFSADGSPGFFPFQDATQENGQASYDPFEFQTVWPKWDIGPDSKAYSFTVEFHSLFTYLGGETFTFIGDDDVFVYINGFIELELGGRHPAATGVIFLDSLTYSTLEVGKTYTIDLFHAERQAVLSNFAIISTLTEPLSIDDVGVTGFDWPAIDDPNFFTIGDQPETSNDGNGSIPLIAVLQDSNSNGVRYLFLERKLLLDKGFIVEVGINISGRSSSGFSILLHNAEVENLPLSGRSSRFSEFEGIAQEEGSLGLSVDLCKERLEDPENCTQELALVANGRAASMLARTPVVGRLADGRVHVYTIRYTLETEYLEVFIDDSLFLLQSGFQVADFIGSDATTVGISLFDDSLIPTQSPTFEETIVSISSFRVVVGEFRNDELFSILDLAILGTVGAVTFILVLAGIFTRRDNFWMSLHAVVAFAEDATAIYLLVEKACEVCPGTPATDLFLIFFGMELLFQTIPHLARKSIVLRFILYLIVELIQLFLFLNLLEDTINKNNAYLFIIFSCIQGGLLTLDALTAFLLKKYGENTKAQDTPFCVYQAVMTRLFSDWLNTVIINAFPLLTVFVFARSSAFQEKWYQVLVAQNLWYRAIVIDSMVSDLDDVEYNKGVHFWSAAGRSQYRKEWRNWFSKEKVLAVLSTTHTVIIHFLGASLAVAYLLESPSQTEVIVCFLMFLAFPAAVAYAYINIKTARSPSEVESKSTLSSKP